ncbi:putative GTP-binding protein engB [Cardiosporidium cionae]|uniref:GTP-binding protein engB n=1 Tax=Cardiosporidium cionae TaxID=476202 RepID=A0ABQ7JER2_9APIC|nr:putative GTP-binding protein engB [Cardiosporidium cionae]|eukprot:KAF8822468.1 putative GTP-binding protein engB [Cardiosporidium cionae]
MKSSSLIFCTSSAALFVVFFSKQHLPLNNSFHCNEKGTQASRGRLSSLDATPNKRKTKLSIAAGNEGEKSTKSSRSKVEAVPKMKRRFSDTSERKRLKGIPLKSIPLLAAGASFVQARNFDIQEITSFHFEGGWQCVANLPQLGVPEIAILGRSNVGKSSLINCLFKAAQLKGALGARVSKNPGCTKSINLYSILDRRKRKFAALADLPGYGYAEGISNAQMQCISSFTRMYIRQRNPLRLFILLIDSRLDLQPYDFEMLRELRSMDIPFLVVCTKCDKLPHLQISHTLDFLRKKLSLPFWMPIETSAATGKNMCVISEIIMACNARCMRFKIQRSSMGFERVIAKYFIRIRIAWNLFFQCTLKENLFHDEESPVLQAVAQLRRRLR